MAHVLIIMGSDSDLPVMAESARILDELGISYKLTVVSAHRTPLRMYDFAQSAHTMGIKVIIAGAGGAAHLPGMVASLTPLPVVGVPIKSKAMNGVDSLYSIVQMPPGIPVATMAINGAANAGLMAARIIGAQDEEVRQRMEIYSRSLNDMVMGKAEKLESMGHERYLEDMS